jgi:hypothetical protein
LLTAFATRRHEAIPPLFADAAASAAIHDAIAPRQLASYAIFAAIFDG